MDTKPWENDSCASIKAHFAVFSIPQAAALWCGVTEDLLGKIVSECQQLSSTGFGRSVWVHPYIPCIEPRSRAIAEAMEHGALSYGREDAEPVDSNDSVAFERRHCKGRDLKQWMEEAFPGEKPAFLFDTHERVSGSGISLEDYQTIKAKNEALELRLEKAKVEYRKLKEANAALIAESNRLKANVSSEASAHPRSEVSYQRIIAALLSSIHGELPNVEKHPSFANESALIEALASHYDGYGGLSTSNLSRKFPEAKRALELK
ncbi:MAG: hypothetical protein ABJ360_12565 [Roseobacter sp.]|uniref:hypothetical protein n=1 Tax=Marinobacter TaxID=2742 RepID=UPI002584ADE1|nr:hypothetical protein [Marinobacter salarius]WOI18717.1 hypothetical protein R1T46_18430 [Marinobacter salarius]